jgi:predicted PurR-regulated permease PerM
MTQSDPHSLARRALLLTIVTLGIGAALLLAPLWLSLVLAAWVAALTRPAVEKVSRRLGGRTWAAAAGILILLLGIVVPIVILIGSLVFSAYDFVHNVISSPDGQRALQNLVQGQPKLELPKPELGKILNLFQQYASRVFGALRAVAGLVGSAFIGVFLFFLGVYTLLLDGPRAWKWALRHSPIEPRHLERLCAAFYETGRGLLIGVGLTGLTQGVVATVAYFALRIPSALVLGLLTAIASLIPSVGTALVWLPVTIGLALTGRFVAAGVMAAVGLFVIGTIDNLVRPLFSRFGKLNLPTFLLFVSIFGGIAAVGPSGIVLGPLVMRLFIEAAEIAREERFTVASQSEAAAEQQPGKDAVD